MLAGYRLPPVTFQPVTSHPRQLAMMPRALAAEDGRLLEPAACQLVGSCAVRVCGTQLREMVGQVLCSRTCHAANGDQAIE